MREKWQNVSNLGRRCASWLGLTLLGLALTTTPATSQQPAQPPQSAPVAVPMDQPLQLLARARQAYQGVRDYTCLFIKREQVQGRQQPENLIAMKVRAKPFSVYMRWVGPKQSVGQEVCYVTGRNNNMMRARSSGVLNALGFVNLDLRDPRAMENNRHTLADIGIGNLIETLSVNWEAARRTGQMQVRVADYEYNHRRCSRVETTHLTRPNGPCYAYRCIVYFDQQTALPIRIEAYDWPKKNGPPQGELLESYSYADLKINVGLGDEAFNY
jgi:hypothetical protein